MTAHLLGLVLANLCFLAAGMGVMAAAGWWRGVHELIGSVGLAYLTGVATFGVVAQFFYVVGASLNRWQVLAICAAPGLAVVAGLRGEAPPRPRLSRLWLLLAIPIGLLLVLMAVDFWYQPLWAYDAWTFWTPKAHALYALNGLDARWFTSADLTSKDYPILLPAVEAAGFRFGGYETSLLDVQSWFFFVAFVRAVYEVGVRRSRPAVLWAVLAMLVVAPSVVDQLAAAEADVPVATLFAAAGLCAWVWLTERRRAGLLVAAVLAAGAAATKVEGLAFALALFVALAFSARRERGRAVEALAAGAGAVVAGALPWRLWIAWHGISSQASFGRVTGAGYLADHVSRVPIATAYMLEKLFDPRAWVLLVPLAVAVAVGSARTERRQGVVLVATASLLAFAALVLAYWSTPLGLHYQLTTSARRVITGIVFFTAALTPLLSAEKVAPAARES